MKPTGGEGERQAGATPIFPKKTEEPLVFELISGILHAPSKGYQAAFDISSSQYALTPENARSVRGRISVSADRNYDDYGRPGAAKAEDGSPEKAGIAAANDNPG